MKKQSGFSFIELLVTISIIAIIAAVGLATYSTSQQKSRDAKRKADLKQIQVALEMCRSETGSYPNSLGTSISCGTPSVVYMSEVPAEPNTDTPYDYNYNAADNTYELCATEAELEETICYSNP